MLDGSKFQRLSCKDLFLQLCKFHILVFLLDLITTSLNKKRTQKSWQKRQDFQRMCLDIVCAPSVDTRMLATDYRDESKSQAEPDNTPHKSQRYFKQSSS